MNRNNFISEYQRINRKFETRHYDPVKKAIHSKVKEVIKRLREGGLHAAESYLHTDISNPDIVEAVTKLYLSVGLKHANINYSRLKPEIRGRKYFNPYIEQKGFGFNSVWSRFILDFLKKYLVDKITFRIAETTRNALLAALAAMNIEGLSVDGMIERLNDWPYERFQAARIVRTEVNRAANTGAAAQASTSEFQQLKEWIAIHDNRTRGNPNNGQNDHANHWLLDTVKIDEEDFFIDPVNGDHLSFPGDPAGSAASTIECRCGVAYTFKRDANGDLIPKRKSTVVIYPRPAIQQTIVTI